MKGETVTVLFPVFNGVDALNNPIEAEPKEEQVENVLVSPGSGASANANADSELQPYGIEVSRICYFPRSWTYKSLRGAKIRIRGREYSVLGDPEPLDGGMSPTAWNLEVDVTDKEG